MQELAAKKEVQLYQFLNTSGKKTPIIIIKISLLIEDFPELNIDCKI